MAEENRNKRAVNDSKGIPLQYCPICGGSVTNPLNTDYGYSISENLNQVARAERERAREFSYLAKNTEIIRDRLLGSHIGKVEEHMVLETLKKAFPLDHFSDELADRHGTDIVAYVNHNGLPAGKISISVKHQEHWNSSFVDQLADNITDDRSDAGILVTTKFPTEALNNMMWFLPCNKRTGALLVKPEFSPAAYFGARMISINKHIGIDLTSTITSNQPLGGQED